MLDKSYLSGSVGNQSAKEIAKFDALAEQWWDPNGKYKTALAFNQARLAFINEQIQAHFAAQNRENKTLSVLDVGCGGGLISEPLALNGFDVTGIDASALSVEVARRHAIASKTSVKYIHCLAEDLDPLQKRYDVVINAEVVEHVPDQQKLIEQCCRLVNPGGILILATLNRTVKSWIIAILGAEYFMRYLPIGTHSWKKFVKPEELVEWTGNFQFEPVEATGMSLNPFSGNWYLTDSLAVNYVLSLRKS